MAQTMGIEPEMSSLFSHGGLQLIDDDLSLRLSPLGDWQDEDVSYFQFSGGIF